MRTEHVVDLTPKPVMVGDEPQLDQYGNPLTMIVSYDEELTDEEYEARHGDGTWTNPVIEAKKARHRAALQRLRKRAASRWPRRLTTRDLDDLMVVLGIHEDAADDNTS